MRLLEPVYRKYRDKGLTILAVNVRQDRETAARFIAKLGISYDTLLDESGEVARAYGVVALPTTFFVDNQGVLRSRILGESTPETFEQVVTGLLQE
jgi:peroxiredoxin